EADTARAHTERDEADDDEAFDGDQGPVAAARAVGWWCLLDRRGGRGRGGALGAGRVDAGCQLGRRGHAILEDGSTSEPGGRKDQRGDRDEQDLLHGCSFMRSLQLRLPLIASARAGSSALTCLKAAWPLTADCPRTVAAPAIDANAVLVVFGLCREALWTTTSAFWVCTAQLRRIRAACLPWLASGMPARSSP